MTLDKFKGYTPGPWESQGLFIIAEQGSEFPRICKADTLACDGTDQDATAKASEELSNAALIAAAPDLLTLARMGLELAQGVVEKYRAVKDVAQPGSIYAMASAIIEKSEAL